MLKKKISQSQIVLYRDCPYAYALHYKYEKEAILYDPTIMAVGKIVHETIERYYNQMYEKGTTEEDVLAKTYFILRRMWDTTLPSNLLNKAYTCLSNFAKYEIENANNGIDEKPLSELTLETDDMLGIIDVLYQEKKIAGDFKTNIKPSVSQNYKIQATMYKYLLEETMGISVRSFNFIFLYGYENRLITFTEKSYSDLLDIVIGTKNAIIGSWKKDSFKKEPRTEHMCKYCQYNYYCGGVQ